MRDPHSRRLFAAALVTAALAGTFGHADAQTAVIFACVNPAGQTRIVGQTQACLPNETRVQWNVAGPQGPPGPQGPAGPIGPAGAKGDTGAAGANGAPG